MAKKTTFTPTGIDALKSGKLADGETPGLFVEVLGSGKKAFKFSRRLNPTTVVRGTHGTYPAKSIASAREWARGWNEQIEEGSDPRIVEAEAAQAEADAWTLDKAHIEYMKAVEANDHKVNRKGSKRPLKAATIVEKQAIYNRNVTDIIGSRPLLSVTKNDLVAIIKGLGARAPTQANRTGAELKVFFNWCMSLKAQHHEFGLEVNPAASLGELWYAEEPRERWLDEVELPLFLKALAPEPLIYRRALLLFLLTGVRKNELLMAPSTEYRADVGMWVLPGARTKNHEEHPIVLGDWGRSLMATDTAWIIQSRQRDRNGDPAPFAAGWPKIVERIRARMWESVGIKIEHFHIHDLRRTFRSHIDDLVDEALAERMMNHKLRGLIGRYNRNKRAAAMAAGFRAWDEALAQMARDAGVGEALGVPVITKEAAPQATPALQHA